MNMVQDEIAQIRRVYPELQIHSVRLPAHTGQFSTVIRINDSLVFRFPRSPAVAQEMAREVRILQAIKGQVPLPIPDPIYIHTNPQADKVLFMGYTWLAGEPMASHTLDRQDKSVMQRFARQLADFLQALHRIPPTSLGIDLPINGTHADWERLYEEFREKLYPFMRPDAQAQVSANFETALNDAALWHFTPVLCHGDFGTSNILYDPQTMQVSGIIDFGFCGPGDPAQDVGAVWSLGDHLMPHFLACYPEMRATLPRVKFIRSTYALQQALYALRDGNQADFEDGIQAYRIES